MWLGVDSRPSHIGQQGLHSCVERVSLVNGLLRLMTSTPFSHCVGKPPRVPRIVLLHRTPCAVPLHSARDLPAPRRPVPLHWKAVP